MNRAAGYVDERTKMPADVEREDRVLAGLSARQLAILGVGALVLWAGYTALRRTVPLAVLAALGAPVALAAAALALGRRDGLGLDRVALAALAYLGSPRRLVPAPEGVPTVPAFVGAKPSGPAPAPLRLPPRGVGDDGTLDLGPEGSALVCRASAPSFVLRTPEERSAMVRAFGRWLNSLSEPVEICVRSVPVDLRPQVGTLREAALGLPHPALEAAALEHAAFIEELGETIDVLARQVLVVLADPRPDGGAAARLRRRAEDATAALGAAGVILSPLGGEAATATVLGALSPWASPRPGGLGAPSQVVTGRAGP